MRHDRAGELLEEDQADEQPVDEQPAHDCDGGWLDRDGDPPRPCLVCKPHLAARATRRPALDVDQLHRGVQLCRTVLADLHRDQ